MVSSAGSRKRPNVVRFPALLLATLCAWVWPAPAYAEANGEPAGDAAGATELPLTLAEAVARALRDNPGLVNARLGRILDQYDLEEAREWFWPQLSFGTLRGERNRNDATGERSWDIAAGPGVDLRLPTGGSFSVLPGWTATVDQGFDTWREGAGVTIYLSQPLLRGGGFGAGRAPVKLACLAEEDRVLQFKAAVMDVVTAVIRAYRAVIEAELEVDINQRSLERARETLAVNRLLVETGRMARQDVTQTESNIADRELGVVESQIRLDDARRSLNVLLDLGGGVRTRPTEELKVVPMALDFDGSHEVAQRNRTPYRQALLNVRRNEIQLDLARNRGLWDLSLSASASFTASGDERGAALRELRQTSDGDYRVGLSLSIPISGVESRRLRRERLSAELAMRQARNALASETREMEIAVRNAVRNVESGVRRYELATSALTLAEEKLELERGKLRLGLSSNFRVAEYQTDLLDAQVGELRAKIDYLNAVTGHDRTIGATLHSWGVELLDASGDAEPGHEGSHAASKERRYPRACRGGV